MTRDPLAAEARWHAWRLASALVLSIARALRELMRPWRHGERRG